MDSRGRGPQAALTLADLLREQGQTPLAATYYLRAIETPADRCFSGEAKLSVNQRYLDMIARPPAEEHLLQAFAGLNACTPQPLPDELLKAFVSRWTEALEETYQPFSDHGRGLWRALGEDHSPPWSTLCELAVARSLLRDGLYETLEMPAGEQFVFDALRQRCFLYAAEAQLGLCRYAEARDTARTALVGSDRVLAGDAHLLIARAAEMALDLDAARRAYRVASLECPGEWDRRVAEYALKRLDVLTEYEAAPSRTIRPLPDDRTTRGDWYLGYGERHYILCAQNFVLDRCGGPGPKLKYRYGTHSDAEPGRRWVTKKSDDDPVALWDPALQTHKPANWDDHGEQDPIGTGPDLLVWLEVPRGAHILSLYFANDYNYYEPNRYYTISVTENDCLQAVTEVEHFGGGVYKRFVVMGPASLELRVWRNLSLNTLLSGVFLDPLPRMQPSPPVPVAQLHPRTESLATRCRVIDGRTLSAPLTMPEQIGSLNHLLRDLSNESPELSWMLSESLRVRGHFRASETAFDAYLAAIADPSDVQAHARVARKLIERDEAQLLRRRVFKDGTHRWDRAYAAHLAALEARFSGMELTDALLSFAREHNSHPTAFAAALALDRIAELSPETVETPAMLLERARTLDRARRPAEAVPVLQRLLEKDLSTGLRTEASWLLLRMQVSSGADAGDVQATYRNMLDLAPTQQQRRDGLYLVAAALIGAGDGATAHDLLNQYESEYGATDATRALLRRSEL